MLAALVGQRARQPVRGRARRRGPCRGRGRGAGGRGSDGQGNTGERDANEDDSDSEGDDSDEAEGEDADAQATRYTDVSYPPDIVKDLLQSFAASDARGIESACWLFGQSGSFGRSLQVAVALVTEHETRDSCIVDTTRGIEELTKFMMGHSDMILLGWCLACPRTRSPTPTAVDLERTWSLQKRFFNGREVLFAICWKNGRALFNGLKTYTLKAETEEILQSCSGRIDVSQYDVSEFLRELGFICRTEPPKIRIVREGNWVAAKGGSRAVVNSMPSSRPVVANAVSQVGKDLLRGMRQWQSEAGGSTAFNIKEWIADYVPPEGFMTQRRLLDTVKEAVKQLQDEGLVVAKKTTNGRLANVTSWSVKLSTSS